MSATLLEIWTRSVERSGKLVLEFWSGLCGDTWRLMGADKGYSCDYVLNNGMAVQERQ